jgi:carbonic anhydrase
LTADAALAELLAGNDRFVAGRPLSPRRRPEDYQALSEAQYPIAAVLGCADSRAPLEILFDVGVGDIFVVRVAGNLVGGAGVAIRGSIEFAVAELNVPLVVVLGHTGCGAVKSAIKHIDAADALPGAIRGLVALVKPAVLQSRGLPGDLLERAIHRNVELAVEQLLRLEPILAPRAKAGTLRIVGGLYDLATGRVRMQSA